MPQISTVQRVLPLVYVLVLWNLPFLDSCPLKRHQHHGVKTGVLVDTDLTAGFYASDDAQRHPS